MSWSTTAEIVEDGLLRVNSPMALATFFTSYGYVFGSVSTGLLMLSPS